MFFLYKLIRAIIRRIRNLFSTSFYKFAFGQFGDGSRIYYNFYCSYPKQISVGQNTLIDINVAFSSEFPNSSIKIGNNVKINAGVTIDYSGNVVIEDGVVISGNVIILSHSHGYDPNSEPVPKPLVIRSTAWIGTRALITENVTEIGPKSIIASGAVVTRDVPPNTIYGGCPAKLIKHL